MVWLDSITDSTDMNLSELWETVDKEAWRAAVYGITKSQIVTEQQQHPLSALVRQGTHLGFFPSPPVPST